MTTLERMARADMAEGYLDGLKSEYADLGPTNRSEAYTHGWLNGRDDRMGSPRAQAHELRERAKQIVAEGDG